jgi:hypothetical protein
MPSLDTKVLVVRVPRAARCVRMERCEKVGDPEA